MLHDISESFNSESLQFWVLHSTRAARPQWPPVNYSHGRLSAHHKTILQRQCQVPCYVPQFTEM